MKTYVVREGDTLSSIAKKFGATVEAIVASNGIKNPNLIRVGQVLKIPVKDYSAIGKQVEQVMEDIEGLPSFKALVEMM